MQVEPTTLATREVGLNRNYLRSRESDFYHVPTERMMSHARTLQAAIDGHYGGTINGHELRKHMNTFVSELLADLGYLRQGSFHINRVPVLVYSHPQTQAFYIVLTRAMYQNVAGRLMIQNNLVGKLTKPWESALANMPARDAFHLLPKLQQAEAQGRLFSVIAAFDLGETLARTRIFLIKAHFSLPGA